MTITTTSTGIITSLPLEASQKHPCKNNAGLKLVHDNPTGSRIQLVVCRSCRCLDPAPEAPTPKRLPLTLEAAAGSTTTAKKGS